jgi:malate dehydrogenase (oxaloacetate-decarboxylating)(NADP+)
LPGARSRRRASLFGAMMVRMGDADGLICGTFGRHAMHREYVENVIGLAPGASNLYAMSRAGAAGSHAVHRRHLHQLRTRPRSELVDMTLLAVPTRCAASA